MAADTVIFLSSNPTTAAHAVPCRSMTDRSSVQTYMVVSFSEVSSQDTADCSELMSKILSYEGHPELLQTPFVSSNEVLGKK